ncbi:PorV/PorQ family protein [Elusimicrobiota bacterium]
MKNLLRKFFCAPVLLCSCAPVVRRLTLLSAFQFLAFFAFFASFAFCAGGPGTTSANFLKIGQGPRAIGMGEAFTAVSDDVFATYWNPSGILSLEHPEATFSHVKLFDDTKLHHLAFAKAYRCEIGGDDECINPDKSKIAWGLQLSMLSMDTFPGYDNNGAKVDDVEMSDTLLGFTFAKQFGRFGLGANAKYIEEKLHVVKAQTFAMDIGAQTHYDTSFGKLGIGYTSQNLLGKMKFDRYEFPLAQMHRFGLSLKQSFYGDPVTIATDFIMSNDVDPNFAFGLEYWLAQIIAFRFGFKGNQDIGEGIRMGVGAKFKVVQMDYAYAGFGDLGLIHRISLTFRFGVPLQITPIREVHVYFKRAMRYMDEERYYDAMLELDEILKVDPGNKKALKLMEEAVEKIETQEKKR